MCTNTCMHRTYTERQPPLKDHGGLGRFSDNKTDCSIIWTNANLTGDIVECRLDLCGMAESPEQTRLSGRVVKQEGECGTDGYGKSKKYIHIVDYSNCPKLEVQLRWLILWDGGLSGGAYCDYAMQYTLCMLTG